MFVKKKNIYIFVITVMRAQVLSDVLQINSINTHSKNKVRHRKTHVTIFFLNILYLSKASYILFSKLRYFFAVVDFLQLNDLFDILKGFLGA